MSLPYTIKPGDTLTKIAAQRRFASWRDIYYDSANAEFRKKRTNPDRIFPGDVLMIPGDAPSPKPPAPQPTPAPTPSPKQPPTLAEVERNLKTYLTREARRDVVTTLGNHTANLIAFGEVHHVNDEARAELLSSLVQHARRFGASQVTHFHASERFKDTTRKEISEVLRIDDNAKLHARLGKLSDEQLRRFKKVLATANGFPGRRYAVLPINVPGDKPKDDSIPARADARHAPLFNSFNLSASLCPDVPLKSITSAVSRGNILLGPSARRAPQFPWNGR
jgi:LysM repeat protein